MADTKKLFRIVFEEQFREDLQTFSDNAIARMREYLLTRVEYSENPTVAIEAYLIAKEHRLIRQFDAIYLAKYCPNHIIRRDLEIDMESKLYDNLDLEASL